MRELRKLIIQYLMDTARYQYTQVILYKNYVENCIFAQVVVPPSIIYHGNMLTCKYINY